MSKRKEGKAQPGREGSRGASASGSPAGAWGNGAAAEPASRCLPRAGVLRHPPPQLGPMAGKRGEEATRARRPGRGPRDVPVVVPGSTPPPRGAFGCPLPGSRRWGRIWAPGRAPAVCVPADLYLPAFPWQCDNVTVRSPLVRAHAPAQARGRCRRRLTCGRTRTRITHTHTCSPAHTCAQPLTCLCACTCTHVYTCTRMCAHTLAHMHRHTHTRARTPTSTHTELFPLSLCLPVAPQGGFRGPPGFCVLLTRTNSLAVSVLEAEH